MAVPNGWIGSRLTANGKYRFEGIEDGKLAKCRPRSLRRRRVLSRRFSGIPRCPAVKWPSITNQLASIARS
jgi:hypothetical protein